MKEFIEKLIGRLEEISVSRDNDGVINGCNMGICEDDDCLKCLKKKVISIVNQLAEEYKPKTQADKIRAMNDEELAEFLYGLDHYWDDEQCILIINDNHLNDYKDDILDWLQSEAE